MTVHRKPARLVLEDGSCFDGYSIGAEGTTFGEIVFNTAATGYQEILTDPSYRGQIVMMTYPEIGNYGINPEDYESSGLHAAGLVVRRLSPLSSNWRAQRTLQDFLLRDGVVGIEGVDTRAITRRIRTAGAMKAGITTEGVPEADFLEKIRSQPGLERQDLVGQVTAAQSYVLENPLLGTPENLTSGKKLDRLVVVDFGVKKSILDYLLQFTAKLVVMPAGTSFQEIMALRPDGVLLSNGPGDPSVLADAVALARQLVDSGLPVFGICLGHQILALACGAQVSKMPFGHHGGNHPVKDLETGQISITSQNHGYSVEFEHFPEQDLKITHLNLNDGSIEGFRHLYAPVMSVQFHPEASPGPHDSDYLFSRFVDGIVAHREKSGTNVQVSSGLVTAE